MAVLEDEISILLRSKSVVRWSLEAEFKALIRWARSADLRELAELKEDEKGKSNTNGVGALRVCGDRRREWGRTLREHGPLREYIYNR